VLGTSRYKFQPHTPNLSATMHGVTDRHCSLIPIADNTAGSMVPHGARSMISILSAYVCGGGLA